MENSVASSNSANNQNSSAVNITKVITNGYLELKKQEFDEERRDREEKSAREVRQQIREDRLQREKNDLLRKQLELEEYKIEMSRPAEVQIADLEKQLKENQMDHEEEMKRVELEHERRLICEKQNHELQIEKIKAESSIPENIKVAQIKMNARENMVKTITRGVVSLSLGVLAFKVLRGLFFER